MTEKRKTSLCYSIRILQHFAKKLWNNTNFVMLFQVVMTCASLRFFCSQQYSRSFSRLIFRSACRGSQLYIVNDPMFCLSPSQGQKQANSRKIPRETKKRPSLANSLSSQTKCSPGPLPTVYIQSYLAIFIFCPHCLYYIN